MANETTVVVIPEARYAVLADGEDFDFERDAEFFSDYDDAYDSALNWSVEEARSVTIYLRFDTGWKPYRQITTG